jgi:hypothetical protein
MTEWDIQPRSSACTSCGAPFGQKQTYHSLLTIAVGQQQRRDLCDACFTSATRDTFTSYWQGEFKLPAPPAPELIQKDTAETLLRKLGESNDPNYVAARYILAVMLERKRILRHRDTVTDQGGNEVLVYEHARTGESFSLIDPHLRLEELEHMQQHVAALLSPTKQVEAEPTVDSASR